MVYIYRNSNIKRSVDILGCFWPFLGTILSFVFACIWLYDLERTNEVAIDAHDSPPVVEHAAVVGGREDSD